MNEYAAGSPKVGLGDHQQQDKHQPEEGRPAQQERRWLSIIPRCGGDLVGYWMPHERTNNIASALITCDSLAAYEAYRARLRSDPEAVANFRTADEQQFILAEERTFLRKVV